MATETSTTIHITAPPEDVSVAQLATGRTSVQLDEDVSIIGRPDVLLAMFEHIVDELRT